VVNRALCTATLGVLALGLGVLAVLTPPQSDAGTPASSVVYQPRNCPPFARAGDGRDGAA
jgi:hypothetical protein